MSNGKSKGKGNCKNGNRYLAWAFGEASHFARRYHERLRRYYQRKLAKANEAVAAWESVGVLLRFLGLR